MVSWVFPGLTALLSRCRSVAHPFNYFNFFFSFGARLILRVSLVWLLLLPESLLRLHILAVLVLLLGYGALRLRPACAGVACAAVSSNTGSSIAFALDSLLASSILFYHLRFQLR